MIKEITILLRVNVFTRKNLMWKRGTLMNNKIAEVNGAIKIYFFLWEFTNVKKNEIFLLWLNY